MKKIRLASCSEETLVSIRLLDEILDFVTERKQRKAFCYVRRVTFTAQVQDSSVFEHHMDITAKGLVVTLYGVYPFEVQFSIQTEKGTLTLEGFVWKPDHKTLISVTVDDEPKPWVILRRLENGEFKDESLLQLTRLRNFLQKNTEFTHPS